MGFVSSVPSETLAQLRRRWALRNVPTAQLNQKGKPVPERQSHLIDCVGERNCLPVQVALA